MIRRTVIAALAAGAVLGASDAGAQTLGFKLGAGFANWSTEDAGASVDSDRITSFMGGGFLRFSLGRLAVQPELLAVTRGAEYGDIDFGDLGRYQVDYVEVPVLLLLPLGRGAGVGPYLFGGPSFGIETGCKVEAEGGGMEVSWDCGDRELFDRNKLDVGLTAGGGLELALGPGALLVEGRYNWGLSNISNLSGVTIRSRTAAILGGYSISVGRR